MSPNPLVIMETPPLSVLMDGATPRYGALSGGATPAMPNLVGQGANELNVYGVDPRNGHTHTTDPRGTSEATRYENPMPMENPLNTDAVIATALPEVHNQRIDLLEEGRRRLVFATEETEAHTVNDIRYMDYNPEYEKSYSWTTTRTTTTVTALIEVDHHRVELDLPQKHVNLLGKMIPEIGSFFDGYLLPNPRKAQLADRIVDYHYRRLQVAPDDDHWHKKGMEIEAFVKLVEAMYIHIIDNLEEFHSYNDFALALDNAQRFVFYNLLPDTKPHAIDVQSGWQKPKKEKVLSVKNICNQSNDFSARQLRRVQREIIQRNVAAERERIAREAVPVDVRARLRTTQRRAARKVKQTLIEEQAGLSSILLAPLVVAKTCVTLPINAVKTLRRISRLTERLTETDGLCDKVSDACEKVSATADDLNSPDGVLHGLLGSVVEKVSGAADSTKNLFDMLVERLESVKQILLPEMPPFMVQVILAGFIAFLLMSFKSPLIRVTIIGVSALLLGPHIKSLLDEIFKRDLGVNDVEPEVEQQSGFDSGILAQIIGTMLVTAVFAAKRPKDMAGLVTHVVFAISLAPRAIKGIESLIDAVVAMAEIGCNAIRGWLNRPPIKFANKFSQAIGDLAERVYAFEYKANSGTTGMDSAKQYTHILGLLHEVQKFLTIYVSDKEVSMKLNELKRILLVLAHPHRQMNATTGGNRVQPASVIMGGTPGIGKTTMVKALSLTVMKLCGELPEGASAADAAMSVFTKPKNSAYMDGYTDQFCYAIDDLFQLKPSPNMEGNEFADIMTYYGSFTAMLNMAECEKKGMFPFSSKLLLMTTNCTDLNQANVSQILLSEEALRRRIDFHVEIAVRPEFRRADSKELDFEKFDAEFGKGGSMDIYPWHVWEYWEVDFASGYKAGEFPPGTGKPFKELIIRIANKIKMNKNFHLKQDEWLNKLINADITEDWLPGVEQQSGEVSSPEIDEAGTSYPPNEHGWADVAEPKISSRMPKSLRTVPTLARSGDMQPEDVEFDQEEWDKYQEEFLEREGNFHKTQQASNRFKKEIEENVVAGYVVGYTHAFQVLFVPALVGATYMAAVVFRLAVRLLKTTWKWIKELLWGKRDEKPELQSNGPKARQIRFAQQIPERPPNPTMQSGTIPDLWYNVYRNSFKMSIKLGDEYITLGQILFLRNNMAVMPLHFISDIKKHLEKGTISHSTEFLLRGCAKKDGMKYRNEYTGTISAFLDLKAVAYEDRDLYFVDFNGAMNPKTDIVKFVLFNKEIDNIGGCSVRLDTARMDVDGTLVPFNERTSYFSPSVHVVQQEMKIGETRHKRLLRYYAKTVKGDCGAILSLTNHSATNCRLVAGLHVGHDPVWDKSYATPLDQEVCLEAIRRLKISDYQEANEVQSGWPDCVTVEAIDELSFHDKDDVGFGNFEALYRVDPGVSAPVRSNLVPTAMKEDVFFKEEIASFYGGKEPDELEVMKMGTYTKNDEIVYPVAEATRPFSTGARIINQTSFRRAIGIAMQPFNHASRHFTGRKLTYAEAVKGSPLLGLRSIARQTAVGYPMCLVTGMKDKSYFFGKGDEFDLETPEAKQLESEILDLENLMREGIRPLFVCRDFLKDEVRKKGKSARLIAGTDIRYYILCRQYFGAYVAAHLKFHNESGVCVGINPYSEWGILKEHLLRAGDKVWDGDFAGFDSSQQSSMLWPLLDQINDWYSKRGGQEDNEIRKILFYDLAHSRHVMALHGASTDIVQWMKSLPSGHLLTAIINTMLSMSTIVSAYVRTTDRIDFWEQASLAAQGDDNLVSASDEVIGQFNQITVAKHMMEEFGMVYTAGRKGEELKAYMGIEDVIFLQRRFSEKNGHVVCPIRPESFLHSLYFTKKGSPEYKHKVIVDGIENALQELSMHTEEQWDRVAPRLVEALSMYDAVPLLPTNDSSAYLDLVRTRVPLWL